MTEEKADESDEYKEDMDDRTDAATVVSMGSKRTQVHRWAILGYSALFVEVQARRRQQREEWIKGCQSRTS
ncbi:hypothetical protein SERLADRAFT_380577 [Serpula lacrymans var. lacrymans S7.9]|uniref:Uncharacterized protein n=1 Tax=Serpula lacrymans var. lacrymans (strain S7.9) TaxID=578457 RepID=F8NLT3_SERL9|nr:uncharacterized protein SERLADRAFT_380577 [Serpula lacrymans var. lacrymans S7.9]EGO28633.1 hypothetical protein SERLADRAFT_380577 [Serpula lacrymans var. lacrymans S7.9]